MEQLISNLANAGLISGNTIVLDQYQRVDITDFETLFGSTDGSYAELCEADDNGDGTTKGYKRFFDAWHASGIL
ncbi:hypothetical protein LLG46_01965 [bacterium]|nr:hypothetical protein [bacterium]